MEAQLRSDGDEVALLQTHMAQRWQDKFALDPLLINDIQRPHVAGGERAVTARLRPLSAQAMPVGT